ncbi:hypothetical protein PP637_gp42 [Arthrobacter phage Persistence]|uniref:Uncharacterized protein n=1 Tax=Arthrobacter phage Persistence TaxID=2836007 RepID=A0A8F3IKT2_9CAUD|nr:hypothetical protein PP637_gp42 [Arthrobacter phage Persistence]QWY79672.1 hypothetical protein SEA_PERSISTENCE_42 [Arthrobacter phage Persistence]
MSNELTRTIEDVWDDGNCVGLDGWIGPARGAGEVDSEAVRCRERATEKASAAILAAGYGKPRTISTPEELDALPAWSVVLSEPYTHHGSDHRIAFQRWDDGLWHRGARSGSTHPDNFLPVTVLHEPEAKA